MAGHVVAGVELVRLLSLTGGIELWEGRTADLDLRDVCLVELAPGPAAMARALVAARAYVGIAHPALQAVLAAAPHGQRLALVREPVAGLSLESVLASTGELETGEGATLACSVADGLAALHRRGLSHGLVGPATVRVRPDGSVALLDLAVAAASDHGRSAADDVLDLARTVTTALARDAAATGESGRLLTALDPALSGHPAARPGAGSLASGCSEAAAQLPLRFPPPRRATAGPSAARRVRIPTPPVRSWSPRLVRAAVAASVILGLGVIVTTVVPELRRWRPPARAAAGHVVRPGLPSTSHVGTPSWSAVLAGLARQRARAYAAADPTLLGGVDAPGSSADAIDRANIAAWRESGEQITGGMPDVSVVASARTGATVAQITTVERVASYTVTDGAGHRTTHPAGTAQRWQVRLVLTAEGWRTAQVSPAGAGPASGPAEHP